MFAPKLSKHSQELAERKKSDVPSFEELYRGAQMIQARKKQQAELILKKRQDLENEELTFRPQINHKGASGVVNLTEGETSTFLRLFKNIKENDVAIGYADMIARKTNSKSPE